MEYIVTKARVVEELQKLANNIVNSKGLEPDIRWLSFHGLLDLIEEIEKRAIDEEELYKYIYP